MRGLDSLERRFVKWRHGSPHPNYRQPIWRNLRHRTADEFAWSEEFTGDADASSWTSREWRKAAVISIDPFVWDNMVKQSPEGVPALIFRDGDKPLRIGYLSSHEDLGRLRVLGRRDEEVYPYPGHGLRIGRFPVQFTIGLAAPEGLLTPPQEAIISHNPVDIMTIGQPGGNYEHVYFSS